LFGYLVFDDSLKLADSRLYLFVS